MDWSLYSRTCFVCVFILCFSFHILVCSDQHSNIYVVIHDTDHYSVFRCSGAMKCLLNGVLEQRDTICMNLYKRAYPKWPNHHYPLSYLWWVGQGFHKKANCILIGNEALVQIHLYGGCSLVTIYLLLFFFWGTVLCAHCARAWER